MSKRLKVGDWVRIKTADKRVIEGRVIEALADKYGGGCNHLARSMHFYRVFDAKYQRTLAVFGSRQTSALRCRLP